VKIQKNDFLPIHLPPYFAAKPPHDRRMKQNGEEKRFGKIGYFVMDLAPKRSVPDRGNHFGGETFFHLPTFEPKSHGGPSTENMIFIIKLPGRNRVWISTPECRSNITLLCGDFNS